MRVLVLALLVAVAAALPPIPQYNEAGGKNWALLIAGSNTWGNYRHQADVYHSYQIVKSGGIPDENIVVMHYDDIANSSENPKAGTVINKPDGSDVYHGVPKDYTGSDVSAANFLAVLLGDKSKVKGGSGKVIASGPDDIVFVYYADHGGTGILGMPEGEEYLYGKDIISTLKQKNTNKGFKQLVFYLEACESGSIFEDVLPSNINVYATTAANPSESSWGCYCPGMPSPPPTGYDTCLGDLYSVAWLENADSTDLTKETLLAQYTAVKNRVSQNGTYEEGSHVMQYGDTTIDTEESSIFEAPSGKAVQKMEPAGKVGAVDSRDAILVYLNAKYMNAKTPEAKSGALVALEEEISFRLRLDGNLRSTVDALTRDSDSADEIMTATAKGVTHDWDCFKGMISTWNRSCGKLREYGMKHARVFANLCNAGFSPAQMAEHAQSFCQE